MPPTQPLIVLSHLRWDFVFQRPQHLMTRLARHYRVFYVEEPTFTAGPSRLEFIETPSGVTVCKPHTTVTSPGFHDDQLPAMEMLLEDLVDQHGLEDPIVWLYTPMALPLAGKLNPRALIYDCMDELSAFLNAPRQLLQRERALLNAADLVFTGGPSLYEAKRDRHPSVHCFPSSVDAQHFGRAAGSVAVEHPLQATLPHPRLGFYGVLDERLDLGLIDAVARARPEWQIVLVGPVVKIDPATLPRRANIHYFGQQPYESLPDFLAGWDVCLLPFALNAATRYISPTKTLEYMAAARPIVSTPIRDVVAPYSTIVGIAANPEEFLAACEHALSLSPPALEDLRLRMSRTVAGTSWDRTAERMRELMDATLAGQGGEAPPDAQASRPSRESSRGGDAGGPPVVVIGAGPTGLSAAYHLGDDCLLIDRNDTVGGWCRSITDGGFTFDYAGHIMFSNDPYVHEMYERLLGDNVHWQDREAWIYSKNVYTRYPFQGALYGLPPEVLKECIVGAIEARFGSLKPAAAASSSAVAQVSEASRRARSSPSACKAESITDCCGDGVVETFSRTVAAPRPTQRSESPRNFEEFIYKVWGRGVAKHFAIPYNQKLWAVPLDQMETSWLGGRVPMPDLEEMIAGALQPVPPPMGPNARFGYPLRGGFQALMDGFLPHLEGRLRLGTSVVRVNAARHELQLDDGTSVRYEQLISTMPLPVLVGMLGPDVPAAVQAAAAGLRHVSVRCVNLGVARENVTEKHWIYYPEDTVFHRVFVQGNASPHCNPAGGFGLTCEITYSPYKPLPWEGDALIDRCIADCVAVGLLRADDAVIVRNEVDMPYAYVVYDHARAANVQTIRDWLRAQDIILAGRYSEWEYYNSDHAFLAGRKAAETAREAARTERQPSDGAVLA